MSLDWSLEEPAGNKIAQGVGQEGSPVVVAVAKSDLSNDVNNDNAADEEDSSAEDVDGDDTTSIDRISERLAGECEYVDFVQLVDFLGVLKSEPSPTSTATPVSQWENEDSDDELDILMVQGEMEKGSGDGESPTDMVVEKDNAGQEGNHNGTNKGKDAEYDEFLGVLNSASRVTNHSDFLKDDSFNSTKGLSDTKENGTPNPNLAHRY